MENATLFTLCSVLGLKAASICGVVAKRTDSESVAPHEVYEKAETTLSRRGEAGAGKNDCPLPIRWKYFLKNLLSSFHYFI